MFWLASCFSKIKKPNRHFFRKSKWDCRWTWFHIYHSNILIWTSTCGSVRYKRNIQNRDIQSKRVLGLTKYRHRLADHKKVTQQEFFVERCSHFETYSRHNRKTNTTAQLYRTLSTYVTQKTISRQNQKTNTTPQLYCTLST